MSALARMLAPVKLPEPKGARQIRRMNIDAPVFKGDDEAPAVASRQSARMKALHADPAFKAKNAARMKALHADPAFKAKNAARMRLQRADPAFEALRAAAARAAFKARSA